MSPEVHSTILYFDNNEYMYIHSKYIASEIIGEDIEFMKIKSLGEEFQQKWEKNISVIYERVQLKAKIYESQKWTKAPFKLRRVKCGD